MRAPDEHIDAVARAVDPRAFNDLVAEILTPTRIAIAQDEAKESARLVLRSTDPAVHAAMLDALTRHGVLTRAWTVIGDDEDGEEWIVDALWAEREEAEQWTRKHGGHVVGRLHEADWHEVAP